MTDTSISIHVNGTVSSLPHEQSVEQMLTHLGLRGDRVAVELNKQLVPKRQWGTTPVTSGAQVEIVEFVGGG